MHGERERLCWSFYPDLNKTQLFTRLMGKPSPVARDFLRRSEKETGAREGEQGSFFFVVGRNPCSGVREGKRRRSTVAGVRERERVSEGGRMGEGRFSCGF
jgi:hypothetical protein